MSIGVDLGSSSVKVILDEDPTVHRWRPVDPELHVRIGTSVPLVRRVERGASVESPETTYVRELARALRGAVGEGVTVVAPDWWSRHARATAERALQGRTSVPVQFESAAVAATRASSPHRLPSTIAVLDVGAGTCSATIVGNAQTDPVVVGRSLVLNGRGGDELDRRLMQHVLVGLRAAGLGLNSADSESLDLARSLLVDVRHAKERLSNRPSVSLTPRMPDVETELRIVRAEFDEIAEGMIQALVDLLHTSIDLSAAEERVGAVLLVGGGASIPLVTQRISTELGLPVILDDEPATLAVRGAALGEIAEPARKRWGLRRKPSGPQHVVFALDEQQVIRVEEPAPPEEPAAADEVIEPTDESERLAEPVPDFPGLDFVEEDVALPDPFDEENPLEIRVTTDNESSPFARTAAHWVDGEGNLADAPAEGRVDDDGGVWLRVDGTEHGLDLGKTHAGLPVTVVLLGLHVLITETATGALLRELQLDPDQDHRPSDPSDVGDKKQAAGK